MRVLIALLLFSASMAGCLAGDAPPESDDGAGAPSEARLVCIEELCNFQATPEPTRQANELSIAVNPLDPLNIIASGKDYFPPEAGDCVRDGIYVTTDGGVSWQTSNVPGSPWRLASNDPASFEPHPDLSKFWCVTDPVVAFAGDGTAYWTFMPYQCDTLSGSATGDGVLPDGGFNDWFWTCSSMYVAVSEDGGLSWPIIREVAFGPRLEHDKQWLSVAPDGTVLLCWDRDPSYQITSLVPVGDNAQTQLFEPGYMVCSTSTDKGRSWSEVTDVNPEGTWQGFLPWVDWTRDNVAWMAALDGENVIVSQSEDGLTWGDPLVVGNYTNPPPSGAFGWPALAGSDFRIFALPALAIDRSDGPHSGNIYVTWFDHAAGDGDVLMTVSRDGGLTWTEPVRIHDDAIDSGIDQFMPAVSVGPDGTADVVWYDSRDDPDDHLFTLYHAYSIDGGETWSAGLRVGEELVDEQYSHHQNGMVFMGDYIDIDSTWGHAHPVWVDTRNEKADAMVATIARPSANPA